MHFPLAFLFGAGVLAAGMNALAGGGSFVSIPALIAVGVPSVAANASSTVALWPGGIASSWAYHEGFRPVCGIGLGRMLAATSAGGLVGSLLLLRTSSSAFNFILPWLLLIATLALAFAPRAARLVRGRVGKRTAPVLLTQFVLGMYGGYFGGAVGLMMLAAWALFGETGIKTLNAPRTLLVVSANTVAIAAFVVAGIVRWPETLVMLAGGLIGGAGGARLGRVIPSRWARPLMLCWTTGITCLFFARAYFMKT